MELTEIENEAPGKNLATTDATSAQTGQKLPAIARNFLAMPKNRQIGVIIAAASSLALIVALLLWAQHGEYERLFGAIPEKDAGEIVEALKKMDVDYKLDSATGAIEVPADQVHELRLKLASQGLPKESAIGFELLERGSSLGSSQMMEGARYQHALEGEIARSIATLRNVKAARVHLAIPKESVFVRNPRKPSASVVVELTSGYGLDPGQVDGIVHLVAASVPQLEPAHVTVVDQRGHLLNSADASSGMNLTGKQFDYKKQVEDHLIERVENILSPVVGRDGLRTQVSADVDFTVTERTQELYNPDLPALRSEQTQEEQNRNKTQALGIPGALSNQPPPAGVAPEVARGQAAAPGNAAPESVSQSKSSTRNYELDKTISHSRLSSGDIRRLTVAVVVDHQRILQPDGSYHTQPYSDEDLTRFTSLVKEAVGYDASRGDRVTVTNAAFHTELDGLAQAPLWERPWFSTLLKYGGIGLSILLLVLGVLRPLVKALLGPSPTELAAQVAADGGNLIAPEVGETLRELSSEASTTDGSERLALMAQGEDLLLLEAPQSYEKRLEFAQRAIDKDPKRVSQVLKVWMEEDDG